MGGMYSFILNFMTFLESKGVPFTDDVEEEYDVLFTNSWVVPYKVVEHIKLQKPSLLVVQRVDGSARDYGRFDDADYRQGHVNMLADLTIFQSEYSRYSTTKKFKVIQQNGPIIYNPVDVRMFRPNGPRMSIEGKIKVCNASFSTNPKKGTWKIGILARKNPDVTFVLCGRYPDLPDLPNIQLLGHLDRHEIAAAMRSCDLFLHLAENDPCPNVALEALASGLPVLYKDSGGTPELVGECGLPVTVDNFRQQLETVFKRHDGLSRAAWHRAMQHFSPDHIFPQYLEAMARANRRPLPTTWDLVSMWLRGYPVIENPIQRLVGYVHRKGSGLLRSLYSRVRL